MKTIVRVLLASVFATALGAGLFAGPASAAVKASTSASVTLSAYKVDPGKSVTVRGTLKKGSRGYGGVWVDVQKRIHGTSKWYKVRSVKTNSSGHLAATVSGLQKNTDVRLSFVGTHAAKPTSSARKTVAVTQWVSAPKMSATTIDAGDYLTLSGTTSASLAGRTATLQARSGTTWKNLATAKVSSKRTYSVKGKAIGRGKTAYRIWVSGTTGVTGAPSAATYPTVYAWYSLDRTMAEGYLGLAPKEYWRVAGKTYPSVLGTERRGDSWRQIRLGNKCRTFKSKIGVMDMSDAGSGEYYLSVGGNFQSRYLTFQGGPKGTVKDISADITAASLIIMATQGVPEYYSSDTVRYPTFVEAKVSCTEEPGY